MWKKLSQTLKSSFMVISIIAMIALWSAISYFGIFYVKELLQSKTSDNSVDITNNNSTDTSEAEDCNVYGINLHGDVVTYHTNDAFDDQGNLSLDETAADDVSFVMRDAQSKDNVKAVVVEIDSSGGSPVGGEEMMLAFKQSKKPVIAFIRNRGLSSAYLAATGAQTIFASKFSDVGSIGVTMSYLQYTEQNKMNGLTYIDLSSGKYKDTGNPDRPLSADEKQLFMRDINISYEYFVSLVAQNRNLSIEKVRKLADGSSVEGEMALKDGLIDKIGLLPDVENFLTEKIGTPAKICWQN